MVENEAAKELSGVLIINKHAGVTSHTIVGIIRRLYGIKRVGHTGTLDPMATGVLPVLVGRAAKASDYVIAEDKTYIAEMQLGLTTDTEDITGAVLTRCGDIPSIDEVMDACAGFVGVISQIPPMYSALKVNGKKLVDLARKGVEVERRPREITIRALDVEHVADDCYRLTVKCSKGTYIRTLCADIGQKLGCGATLKSLCRPQTGMFGISESISVAEIEAMTRDERIALLNQTPVETIFAHMPEVILPEFFARLARNGAEIYQAKIGTDYPIETQVRLSDENGFFAVGEVREYPDGTAIKAMKLFELD